METIITIGPSRWPYIFILKLEPGGVIPCSASLDSLSIEVQLLKNQT